MQWFYLVVAGVFEIVWATFLKLSDGFTRLGFSICTIAGMVVSFYFLARATRTLPIGTAYAMWTGMGAIGAVLVGIFLFKEPVTVMRMVFVVVLLIGLLGLKLTSA